MSKLRSDSVFSQLTPEQTDTLEGWLFEEGISYKEALERVQKEFNLTTSLSGLRRFYQRLAGERSRESLTDTITVCVEAMGAAEPGVLAGGFLTLALKCAVELMAKSPGIRELTALMRVMTSAQALEMKRIRFQREEDQLREQRLKEEQKKRWEEEDIQRYGEKLEARRLRREEKKKAKEAAARANDAGQANPLIPAFSPSGGEGVGTADNIVAMSEGEDRRSQTAATGEGGSSNAMPEAPDIEAAKEAVKPLNAG